MGESESAKVASKRRQELLRQVTSLREEIKKWGDKAVENDQRNQYATQLAALKRSLNTAMDQVQERISKDRPAGQVFKAAVAEERYLLWIRAIWDPFRIAFEQRNSEAYSSTLMMADEAVWACFSPYANIAEKKRSAPLATIANVPPCIRPSDMTRSFVTTSLPVELLDRVQVVLKSLPMAILYLPPTVIASPWQLCLIAHEVGHEVQHIWEDQSGSLVQSFQEDLVKLAGNEWKGWGEEVFADLFSVHCIGPAAAYTLFDFTFGEVEDMELGSSRYPSALVRIKMANRLSAALKLGQAKLPILEETAYCPTSVAARLDEADKVVEHIKAKNNRCLKAFNLDPSEFEDKSPTKALWTDAPIKPTSTVGAIRQLFSQARISVEKVEQDDKMEQLKMGLETRVRENAPPGVRDGEKADDDAYSQIFKEFEAIPTEEWGAE